MAVPTPATVHATFGTATHADRIIRQVMDRIIRIFPEDTPFFALLARMAIVNDGRNRKLEWFRLSEYPRTVVLTAALTAASTSLTVESNVHVTESQVLQDPDTGEQLLVLSKTGTTGITVGTRGTFGGGTPQARAVGDELILLQTAREEGAAALAATGTVPSSDYNYFQQAEIVESVTDVAKFCQYYGNENQADLQFREAMREYKKRMERQFFSGYRDWAQASASASGATTHDRYIMGGARDYVETDGVNIFDANGTITYQELMEGFRETMRQGGDGNKAGFCSRNVQEIISRMSLQWHQANYQQTNSLGIVIQNIIGPGGKLQLMHSEFFETPGFEDKLYIVDPRYVQHHVFRGLADQVHREITGPQKDGNHSIANQITGVHTLAVTIPRAHGIFKNISA